jgi:hypothetical protein
MNRRVTFCNIGPPQTFVGELTPENMSTYRSSTLLEVLMATLLYYLRSYYPNLGHVQVSSPALQKAKIIFSNWQSRTKASSTQTTKI